MSDTKCDDCGRFLGSSLARCIWCTGRYAPISGDANTCLYCSHKPWQHELRCEECGSPVDIRKDPLQEPLVCPKDERHRMLNVLVCPKAGSDLPDHAEIKRVLDLYPGAEPRWLIHYLRRDQHQERAAAQAKKNPRLVSDLLGDFLEQEALAAQESFAASWPGPEPEIPILPRMPRYGIPLDDFGDLHSPALSESSLDLVKELALRAKAYVLGFVARVKRLIAVSGEEKVFSRFGFERPLSESYGASTWCCPNCDGDRFGGEGARRLECLGSVDGEREGCGYWESFSEPRKQGMGKPADRQRG